MRIFTLGKRGINIFLFTLILLTGSSPLLAQENCPIVSDPEQEFCYLSTVADLSADPNGTTLRWYRSQTATNPIPPEELLQDGMVYYAGTESQSCTSSRSTVTATVVDAGPPTSNFGVTFQPCEYSEGDTSTVQDLIDLLQGNEVQIYAEEYDAVALDPNETLVAGENYFAGQRSSATCETSSRLAIRYDPIVALAPDAEPVQTFCQGATVADLQAQGTSEDTQGFRWYSTATSNPPLDPSTTLIDGETYYATQIINRTNSALPPCESMERVEVTVEVNQGDAGEPATGVLCEADVDEMFPSVDAIEDYLLSLLDEGVSQTGTFSPTAEQLAQQYQNDTDGVGDFTTTYTLSAEECGGSVQLTISVIEEVPANAGDDVTLEFNVTDEAQNLYTFLTAEANTEGVFEGYPDGMFDPAAEGPGTYQVTYTVDGTNATCVSGSDSAVFNITVTDCEANAGDGFSTTLCSSEVESMMNNSAEAAAFLDSLVPDDVDQDGTFEPTLNELFAQWQTNPIGTFTTTYTVGEGECTDSAVIEITVVEGTVGNAGSDNTRAICLSVVDETFPSIDEIRKYLEAMLSSDADRGGTFDPTPEELATQYQNAETKTGEYVTTYTVGEGQCTDTAELTVLITEDVDAGTDGAVTLQSDDDPVNLFDYLGGSPDEGGTWTPGDGTFDPATDQPGTFTYTVGTTGCQDSATVVVTVENTDPTDPTECAGTPGLGVICLEDVEPTFDSFDAIENYLLGLLDAGVPRTGTFSPTAEELADIYNSDEDGLGDFSTTYTLDTDSCEDSVEITVRVVETVDAGTDGSVTLDPDDAPVDLFDYLGGDPDAGGTWSPGDGTFDPATDQEGTFTYTVGSESCQDTATVVVTVEDDSTEPEVCNAGDDISLTLCTAEVNRYIENPDEAAAFFSTLIDEEADTNGTFDPSLDELLAQWSADPVGTFTTTYTVTGEECEDTATIEITVLEGDNNAGGDNVGVVCSTEVDEMFPSVDEIRKYLLSLLDAGVSRTGSFSPTASQLANQFQNDADGLGEFTTTYTVGTSGPCTDSALITVNVVAPEPANAGPDMTITLCTTGEAVDLTDFLSEEADLGGSFEELENNIFDPAEAGAGSFDFTYSVDATTSCVEGEDSAVYTVVVSDEVNAGADASITLCNSDVASLTPNGVRNLYLDMLEEGVATDGVFNPTIQELIDQYNLQSNFGDFTTVYTVGSGECTDAVELTVTVLENPDAGTNGRLELEEGATKTEDLFAALGGTPDEGGVWTDADGNEVDATFDPTTEAEGVYTYTVSSENGCSDSATVTVVIGEPVPCPEITEPEQEFCLGSGATVADLAPADVLWYDSADGTEPLAEDTELVDGGVYFAGDPEGQCIERSSVTVTISEVPVSPSVTDFTDCVITGATVADLDIVGDDGAVFTVYSDETLETVVAEDEVLVSGVYYVTQSTAGGCESEAAELTVTLDDTDAPTFTDGGNVFCEFDDATLADLEESVVGDGEITWYATATGTEPLSTAEMLENNVTYYAAITGESGCESSERLPVTVTLEDCEVVIPEAFSPNGDGINDSFVIENLASEYPDFRLEIYNRWGEPVYTGNASTPEWNGVSTEGSFGSGVVPAGVYFYILYYNDGQTAPTQGRLYLSR